MSNPIGGGMGPINPYNPLAGKNEQGVPSPQSVKQFENQITEFLNKSDFKGMIQFISYNESLATDAGMPQSVFEQDFLTISSYAWSPNPVLPPTNVMDAINDFANLSKFQPHPPK